MAESYDPETGEPLDPAPSMGGLVQVAPAAIAPATMAPPSPTQVIQVMKERRALLRAAMSEILVEQTDPAKGGDYGKIPGCGDRPTLLLPGAQKLSSAFQFVPRYRIIIRVLGGDKREYDVKCLLYTLSGTLIAEGEGVCSSLETKYRYRPGPVELTDRPVPKEYWNLRKSEPKKAQDLLGGPGFVAKKDPNTGSWLVASKGETVENPDPADLWNTLKKMGCKRAFIAAVITATNASDVFTQDIEDNPDLYRRGVTYETTAEPASEQPEALAPAAGRKRAEKARPPEEPPPPTNAGADGAEGAESEPPRVGGTPPAGPPATEKQVGAIYSLMRALKVEVTNAEQLRLACRMLAPHDKPEEYSKGEANAAIQQLNAMLAEKAGPRQ